MKSDILEALNELERNVDKLAKAASGALIAVRILAVISAGIAVVAVASILLLAS